MAKAGIALAASTLAGDASAADRQVTFPALGLARLQTAQIHLATPGSIAGFDPQPDPPRPACQATLGFVDANGRPFLGRDGQPVTREVTVEPGQTKSLSLPASVVFGDGTGLRVLFRATARLGTPAEPTMPDGCAGAQLSVEIVDNVTGRTTVALGTPPDPIAPAPRQQE